MFIWNTLLMMLIRIVVAVFISAMAAYAFGRMQFPLKKFWFMICLVPMMVPSQIYILPQYLTASSLHLNNTIWGLVMPGLASTFGIFLLRQFFMTIPNDLEEAAVLDGVIRDRSSFGSCCLLSSRDLYHWPFLQPCLPIKTFCGRSL